MPLTSKDTLMEKVRVEIETTHYSTFAHKLRQIYHLHANLKSAYYLLFKAILKLKRVILQLTKRQYAIDDGLKRNFLPAYGN